MERPYKGHPNQGCLADPLVREPLIRELAQGVRTLADLARRHGVSYQAVQKFARRHDTEIAAMVIHLGGTAEQWAADKRAHLQECSRLVSEIAADASAPPEATHHRLEALRAAAGQLSGSVARGKVCA